MLRGKVLSVGIGEFLIVTELGSGQDLCLWDINLASAPDGVEMGDKGRETVRRVLR